MKPDKTYHRFWMALTAVVLIQTGCQGSGNGTQPNGTAANNAATANSSNGTASAPNNAAATAPVADPGSATGPVALAADSSLPAPCQEFIRKTQACLDNLPGEAAEKAHNEWTLRTTLHSRRGTWALAQDDTYRTRLCENDLQAFPKEQARLRCGE